MQLWYVNYIERESILYPIDDGANNQDEGWALETEEISAWKYFEYFQLFTYFPVAFFWI